MSKSKYLSNIKPVLKKLLEQLLKEYEYASILATDCNGKSYFVSRNTISIGDTFTIERGVLVRVYSNESYSEYAFNELDEKNLDNVLEEIHKSVSLSNKLSDKDELRKHNIFKEDKLEFDKQSTIEKNPKEFGDKAIIDKLIKIKDAGLRVSDKIVDFRVVYNYLNTNKLFLSPNRDLEQSYTWSEGNLGCVASNGKANKQNFTTFSGAKGAELLDEMEKFPEKTAEVAIELFDSVRMKPGTYDVICTPAITGLIAHEAFGHGVEMDMYVKDRAKSKDYIGKYVASPLVTMVDGAAAASNTGSFYFDDEGNLAGNTTIIEKGILKKGLCDGLTSLEYDTEPTGNGRRENYDRKAYARMTNTFIKPGESKLDDMIASIEYGIMLDSMFMGMEDPKNWGIQCVLNIGREIKDGKFTGKIFSPIMMTGYVPDLLKSITMVSDDFKLDGCGYCGKGYKEYVKVSEGGPYIKCKARLG